MSLTTVQVTFASPITDDDKESIKSILTYWGAIPAITRSKEQLKVQFPSETQAILIGAFGTGFFLTKRGNLNHKGAMEYGSKEFKPGLMEILTHGVTPKTDKGTLIIPPIDTYPEKTEYLAAM